LKLHHILSIPFGSSVRSSEIYTIEFLLFPFSPPAHNARVEPEYPKKECLKIKIDPKISKRA